MPLGKGIAEVFGAIPDRIEVSGHEPTWKVTGGHTYFTAYTSNDGTHFVRGGTWQYDELAN